MNARDITEALYDAFQRKDGAAMASLYAADAVFSDPVFPSLKGQAIGSMWQMLCSSGKDLEITYQVSSYTLTEARVRWDAHYTFSTTGRKVHNRIDAEFHVRNGKITSHRDRFSFWRWSRQALGPLGWFLGWTPVLKAKVRKTAAASLAAFETSSR